MLDRRDGVKLLGRVFHTSAVHPNEPHKIFVLGGKNESEDKHFSEDLLLLDTKT